MSKVDIYKARRERLTASVLNMINKGYSGFVYSDEDEDISELDCEIMKFFGNDNNLIFYLLPGTQNTTKKALHWKTKPLEPPLEKLPDLMMTKPWYILLVNKFLYWLNNG